MTLSTISSFSLESFFGSGEFKGPGLDKKKKGMAYLYLL